MHFATRYIILNHVESKPFYNPLLIIYTPLKRDVYKRQICYHIKVSCSGQTKYDSLLFSGLFALQCFINCHLNRMTAFRCRQDTFDSCKSLCRFEYACLFYWYKMCIRDSASILKASHNLDVTLVGIGEAPVRDADHLSDYPFDTATINELVDAEAAGDICCLLYTSRCV